LAKKLIYHAPDGKDIAFDPTEGWTKDSILSWARGQYPDFYTSSKPDSSQDSMLGSLGRSFARSAGELGAYLGDIFPGMVESGIGFDERGRANIAAGEKRLAELQKEYPASVGSASEIRSIGDAARYTAEQAGSSIPSVGVGLARVCPCVISPWTADCNHGGMVVVVVEVVLFPPQRAIVIFPGCSYLS